MLVRDSQRLDGIYQFHDMTIGIDMRHICCEHLMIVAPSVRQSSKGKIEPLAAGGLDHCAGDHV